MKVLIYGPGGVGGFIGSFLEKKKLELDWLSGSIIELAEKKGIKCETHKEIVKKIKT